MTFVVIRLLNPADYGLFAVAAVCISLGQLFSDFGIGQSIIQSTSLSELEKRAMFGMVIVVSFALTALVCIASPAIASWYDEPQIRTILPVLSLQLLFGAISSFHASLLSRDLNFAARSVADIGSSLVGGGASVSLALMGFGVWALVGSAVLSAFIRSMGMALAAAWWYPPTFRFSSIRHMLRYSTLMLLQRFVWWLYVSVDTVLLARILGAHQLGYYSVGFQLASTPQQKASPVIIDLAFSGLSRISGDVDLVSQYLQRGLGLLSAVAIPVFFGISSIAPELVVVLLGEKWLPSVQVVQLISLVMPLRMLNTPLMEAMNALGRPEQTLYNNAIIMVIMVVAISVGAQFGIAGVCFAWIIGFPIAFAITAWRASPVLRMMPSVLLWVMWRPCASGIAMYFSVALARPMLMDTTSTAHLLVVLIAIGASVYLMMEYMIDRPRLKDTIGLFLHRS